MDIYLLLSDIVAESTSRKLRIVLFSYMQSFSSISIKFLMTEKYIFSTVKL